MIIQINYFNKINYIKKLENLRIKNWKKSNHHFFHELYTLSLMVLRCWSRLLFNCRTSTVDGTPNFNVLPGVNNILELSEAKLKEEGENDPNEFCPKIPEFKGKLKEPCENLL